MAKADPKKAPVSLGLDWQQYGMLAFLVGVLVAIVMAVGSAATQAWASNVWLVFALVVLGLAVGLLNITKEETHGFLMAAVALLVAKTANLGAINTLVPFVGTFLEAVVSNAITLVAPAAVVVA
ncbi:MAG: hypothetical protein AABX74_00875, partial [Nanoarchaeota archaeon]